MDDLAARAIDEYHALLRDEPALRQELEERFLERMQAANLTFGGRTLCPFPRPNFVSPAAYGQIRAVCRGLFRAIEKAEAALGTELWDRVDLSPAERELCSWPSGYRRSSPLSRLDSFLTPRAYQFVELNAETPAGIGYNEVLADVFLELPIVKRLGERWTLTRFEARERVLSTLLACYREAGGRAASPTIAVVDYEDVPTRTEHHMFRAFFESRGCPSVVCDPRHLTFEQGRLRFEGTEIDVVYKRLLVNELLERERENQALLRAARAQAVVVVNPFRCKPIHKKAIFAVLTDDELQRLFDPEERAAIRAHVPWTRRVSEAKALREGTPVDLPAFILENRERLVMKPNDEYGGKGVFIGWETSDAEWRRALETALAASYVVQEKVELLRQTFPALREAASGPAELSFRDLVIDLDPFVFDGEVEGFLTRLSGTSLANVTSGGGQIPSFLVEPKA
jgi:hypothetical protein